jgi:oxalate decarboxylase
MRELHWHPNTDEWQYYIEARRAWACSWRRARPARSISRPATSASCLRHGPLRREHRNDTAALPRDIKSDYYADVSLNQWLALTPPELVNAHLKLGPQFAASLRKDKVPVVPV